MRRMDLLKRRPNPSAESMLLSAAAADHATADPFVGVTTAVFAEEG